MSTTNTETLKLYKDTKLYNGSRYKVFQDNKTMEQYLGTPDYTKTVYYKSINEPIVINESIKNCDEFTYGSITNDGKIYYFFVDEILTDAYKQTTINYTIDWWSTNWNNIECTKAHLTRSPIKPDYMPQPFSPFSLDTVEETITDEFCIMATYIPSISENQVSYISQVVIEGTLDNIRMVEQGYWYQYFGFAGADVKDCFVVPYFSYNDIGRTGLSQEPVYVVRHAVNLGSQDFTKFLEEWKERFGTYNTYTNILLYTEEDDSYYRFTWNPSDPQSPIDLLQFIGTTDTLSWTEYQVFYTKRIGDNYIEYKRSMMNSDNITYPNVKTLNLNLVTNEKQKQGIIDWNGNIIWECPYGINVNRFTVRLEVGISHVFLKFLPLVDDDELGTLSELLTGRGFIYDCRHPGLFVDSYQDYILKNREYDIAMRNIQSEKQELQAWASTAENIGFGYAFGGAGTGAQRGAVSAGIGGVIEAVSTNLINSYFDPQIQVQYEKRYARMTDQISIIGDSITAVYFYSQIYKYTLTMDTPSQNKMKADISNNGYVCDECTGDLSGMFTQASTVDNVLNITVKPVFQADNVVVEGACNLEGKRQVVQRLMNGVEFI